MKTRTAASLTGCREWRSWVSTAGAGPGSARSLDGRSVTLLPCPTSPPSSPSRTSSWSRSTCRSGSRTTASAPATSRPAGGWPGAASSVFPAPVRPVLRRDDYDEARTTSLAASGRSLSVQAFGIWCPRSGRSTTPSATRRTDRVHEVHPELSFRALDGRVTDRKGSAQRARSAAPRAASRSWTCDDALADAPARRAGGRRARRLRGRVVGAAAGRRAGRVRRRRPADARGRPMRICW